MKCLIVIPARYQSTRFPGKPLAPIGGVPLLERVVRIAGIAASQTGAGFVVAADDERVAELARAIGAPVVMTPPKLASGSDRALAAAQAHAPDADFIVNLQGDLPFTPPSYVAGLIEAARASGTGDGAPQVFTPVVQLSWEALDGLRARKQITPFSGTTCIVGQGGRAHWFSKNILPALRDEAGLRAAGPLAPVFRHIGLYGYRAEALRFFVAAPVGHYEQLEGLEQLRFLEAGVPIQTVAVKPARIAMWGIDTPQDAALAEQHLARAGDPLQHGLYDGEG
ncbi:3-deoxy-manno-octulosonate cytidylyltransferase family protein [Ancylobacter lacus]|uniref:3-deoxy-manno-octulosonate cytidylyltransferase family protein n=1 Tax=Ancylobacter lacus TaxID=2579970 RepID=UPI001BCED2E1|nr:manno-octulosonate cytidylyltransferase [Ancylobacter lacus]MBS7540381.1 3-deoxy-manno-octulosonate cytidylyltransferase [Ancylobacter lacus]